MIEIIKSIRQMSHFYERFHNPKLDRQYADAMRMGAERASVERYMRRFQMPDLPLESRTRSATARYSPFNSPAS